MSKKKQYVLRAPLNVKGGIRSQAPNGGHVRAWWSRKWTEVIEHFRLGSRLGRGRNYAVTGQVSSLDITPGCVAASVQGTNKEPYMSTIRFRVAEGGAKVGLIREMRRYPMLVARLLVADLPLETEEIFRKAKCPLFPQRENDMTSRCSCPDYANPCKHLAAVYYLLGEAISKNPMLLLSLRGISRAELLGAAAENDEEDADADRWFVPQLQMNENGGDICVENFYGTPQPPFEDFGTAVKSVTSAPLIYRLGALPFWRGQERFADTLEHLYARAAMRGWSVWAGEPLDLRREDEKVIITGANLHLKTRRMRADIS